MLIFLDIDGVLKLDDQLDNNFDIECVNIFNNYIENLIIKNNNPKIIISSDWQHSHSLYDLQRIFNNNNCISIPYDVTGTTNYLKSESLILERSFNIINWCKINQISDKEFIQNTIILDDLELHCIFNNAYWCNPIEGIKTVKPFLL